jgi:hypothetical protein
MIRRANELGRDSLKGLHEWALEKFNNDRDEMIRQLEWEWTDLAISDLNKADKRLWKENISDINNLMELLRIDPANRMFLETILVKGKDGFLKVDPNLDLGRGMIGRRLAQKVRANKLTRRLFENAALLEGKSVAEAAKIMNMNFKTLDNHLRLHRNEMKELKMKLPRPRAPAKRPNPARGSRTNGTRSSCRS